MTAETLFEWISGAAGLAPVRLDPDVTLLAADSWLVSEGKVRGFELHWERFSAACKEACEIEQDEIDAFRRHVAAALPRRGQWFPRIELAEFDGKAALQFRLRPAPPLTQAVRMMRWPTEDLRILPRRKGPDLALLGRLRQQAIAQGADEALLTTPDGIVLEGLATSVAWWENGTLCMPDPGLALLPGVTCRLLLQVAHAMSVSVRHRRAHIDELNGRTVWTMNALHGIRPVVQWISSDNNAGHDVDHRSWQSRLSDLGVHLDAYSEEPADAQQ